MGGRLNCTEAEIESLGKISMGTLSPLRNSSKVFNGSQPPFNTKYLFLNVSTLVKIYNYNSAQKSDVQWNIRERIGVVNVHNSKCSCLKNSLVSSLLRSNLFTPMQEANSQNEW